ncbi:MAG: hypothetical protein IID39_04110 [Planctomycetes bacterium]|nr:hypothetical protein [Planctomycetota bacterium]
MADLFLTPYIRSVWETLAHRLGPTGRMCLFGAGAHTRWLLSITRNLPHLPIECILDDNPAAETLNGIPVRRPAEISIENIDLILVSSDRWEEELVSRCRHLWGDRVAVVRLYEGLPPGPYDKSDDRNDALCRLRDLSPVRPSEPRQVVIVSDDLRAREVKIGYALKHAGWRTVLLHPTNPSFDVSSDFDEVRSFDNEWEALRIACDYAPVVYHIMVHRDYRVAELFLRHRPGVIVVDPYDVLGGMLTHEYLAEHRDLVQEISRERRCLEQADGICCRSPEVDFLEERLGYALPPRVRFADGCWNAGTKGSAISCTPHASGPSDKSCLTPFSPHIVYAGKACGGSKHGQRYAACGCDPDLVRALLDQALHVHLFPSPGQVVGDSEGALAAYMDLERPPRYFHMHQSVPANELVNTLSRYDLAMLVYPELLTSTGLPWSATADKLQHCTSNKLYDYLDAGLPIIHNSPPGAFLADVVERHGAGINVSDWPLGEWRRRLGELDLSKLQKRVADARRDYDVRTHAGELADFYRRVRARVAETQTVPCTRSEEPQQSRDREGATSNPSRAR